MFSRNRPKVTLVSYRITDMSYRDSTSELTDMDTQVQFSLPWNSVPSRRSTVEVHAGRMSREELDGQQLLRREPVDMHQFSFVRFTEQDESKYDGDCCICQFRNTAGDHVVVLTCSHVYHRECALRYFKTFNKCAICKRDYAFPLSDLFVDFP